MARRDRDVEIIPLLPADHVDHVWGAATTIASSDAGEPPVEGSPRRSAPSRWPIIVAAITVVAVVIVAIAASSGSDQHAATTTSVAPVTGVVTSTTLLTPIVGELPGGHFVIDDPALVPYSADVLAPPNDGRFYELWSVNGPESPWVSVEAQRGDVPDLAFSHSSRHLVDGVEVIDSNLSKVATVVRQVDSGWWVVVRASGMADTQLVEFATTLDIVGDRVEAGSGLLIDQRMQSVATASSPDELIFGTVEGESRYALGRGGGLVTLRVSPAAGLAVRPDHLQYVANDPSTDSSGHIRGTLLDSGESFDSWFAAGHRFTLTGMVDVDVLAKFSDEIVPVSNADWSGRVYGLHPDYRLGPFTVNGGGSAGDGSQWSAGVQTATRGGHTWFLWWWTVPHHPERSSSIEVPADLHTAAYFDTIVVPGATYVFASLPSTSQTVPITVTDAAGTRRAISMVPVKGASILVGVARIDTPGVVTIGIGQ